MMKKLFVAALCALVVSGAVSAGVRFYETDRLDEGQEHSYQLKLSKGSSYMVLAAASHGNVDFDVTVLAPDGTQIIASDSTDQNTDWVRFTGAAGEGWHKVKIKAFKGSGWYELVVINTGEN